MPSSGRWVVLFAGDFAAISALRAAALRRLRSETRLRAQCGRRVTFPAMGKSPKDRRGTAQDERSALIFALPPVPHYGGRVPEGLCVISGAQNLSGWSKFTPGHWALALQKFRVYAIPRLRLAMPIRWRLVLGCRARRSELFRKSTVGAAHWAARFLWSSGRPKGLPYPNQACSYEICRAGACPRRRSSESNPLTDGPASVRPLR